MKIGKDHASAQRDDAGRVSGRAVDHSEAWVPDDLARLFLPTVLLTALLFRVAAAC